MEKGCDVLRCVPCLSLYLLAIWGCCLHAYRRNRALPAGDPRKCNFLPSAIWIAPLSLPLLLILWGMAFLAYTLLFGLLLFAFPLLALIIRDPAWLRRLLGTLAERIGSRLLRINTFLLQPFVALARSLR